MTPPPLCLILCVCVSSSVEDFHLDFVSLKIHRLGNCLPFVFGSVCVCVCVLFIMVVCPKSKDGEDCFFCTDAEEGAVSEPSKEKKTESPAEKKGNCICTAATVTPTATNPSPVPQS